MDQEAREIVAAHVGDRSEQSAQALWAKLPPLYRQCAVFSTDEWEAYQAVLATNRHRMVAKGTGLTNYSERFNNPLRQRGSRFVCETLSFSKKMANHIGALSFFIHQYNAHLVPA